LLNCVAGHRQKASRLDYPFLIFHKAKFWRAR
jgi:hypothetical protein